MVEKLVITGGPCSGKTTGIAHIASRMALYGVRPYVVPESATLSYLSTGRPAADDIWRYQASLICLQMDLENHFERIAEINALRDGMRPILVCDRGVLDGKAFCPEGWWAAACKEAGIDESRILASRYSGVVHLVTSAESAPWAYSLANNSVRVEDAAEAIVADHRLQLAWMGHPNGIKVIRGGGDFDEKIEEAANAAAALAGLPASGGKRRRWRVSTDEGHQLLRSGSEVVKIKISEHYIGSTRVQKREASGGYIATLSVRTQSWTTERIIGHEDFIAMTGTRKPDVEFERCSCVIGNVHVEVDLLISPRVDYCLITSDATEPPCGAVSMEPDAWYSTVVCGESQ